MFNNIISSDVVEINAPAEQVWAILADLDRYPEWNPFTYKVVGTLKPGASVDLHVRMPIRGDRIQIEQVRTVERPHMLSWGMKMGFEFLLKALREQKITPLSDNSCSYVTTDAFAGLLTPLVVSLFGTDVRNGFNNVAYALKDEAEKRWKFIRERSNVVATH